MPKIIQLSSGKLTLYNRKEIAGLLGVSTRTVWQYIHDGKLPAVRINHIDYVWEKNFIAFCAGAKRRVEPPQFAYQEFVERDGKNP